MIAEFKGLKDQAFMVKISFCEAGNTHFMLNDEGDDGDTRTFSVQKFIDIIGMSM